MYFYRIFITICLIFMPLAANAKMEVMKIDAQKNAIDHNRYAYDTICRLVDDTMTFYTEKHNYCEPDKKQIFKRIMKEVSFNKSESFVSYRDTAQRCGMLTNIFNLNVKSESREITLLIKELNDLYEKIRNLKYEVENGVT